MEHVLNLGGGPDRSFVNRATDPVIVTGKQIGRAHV